MENLKNKRIINQQVIASPSCIRDMHPASLPAQAFVRDARAQIDRIIHHQDSRLLVICGPCSLHDLEAAKEYALRLVRLHERYKDSLYIVMRSYFEKPRTRVGWKGMINDPELDDSFDIETGLKKAREFLVWLAELGLPAATETLDHITPQYLSDLISWVAIGARTIESQTHREMASGLSMPVGFKNGTDGDLSAAVNAIASALQPHAFLGITDEGQVAVMNTSGNTSSHLILRGGKQPNFDAQHVAKASELLAQQGLNPALMIDCSHGNSNKDYRNQPSVLQDIQQQILAGNTSIIGVMLESHLFEGRQNLTHDKGKLHYGVSITDACISWEKTEALLDELYQQLRTPLQERIVKQPVAS